MESPEELQVIAARGALYKLFRDRRLLFLTILFLISKFENEENWSELFPREQ